MNFLVPTFATVAAAGGVDVLTPALFNGIGVTALLVFSFWLLATGKVYTRHQVEMIEQVLVKRAETAEAALATVSSSLDAIMPAVELQKSMYETLREAAKK